MIMTWVKPFLEIQMTETILPFPDTLEVDEDGYPDEKYIEQLRIADDMPNAATWLIETFPLLVNSIPCGYVDVRDGLDELQCPIKIITYSTGGWSGQEDLINAVCQNQICDLFYLWSWRRGGHYEFRISLSSEKEITLPK
jgi:hypothetical protein